MNLFRRQLALRGLCIQPLQDITGMPYRDFITDNAEPVAAVVDFHAKALLELMQVLVELPAQRSQALVVRRLEGDVDGMNRGIQWFQA